MVHNLAPTTHRFIGQTINTWGSRFQGSGVTDGD
jgi:hypothetical protein